MGRFYDCDADLLHEQGSTIGNPNVDMAGVYNSTQMNSYGTGESVPGNGCQ
jgi:hypothetical protein